MHVLRAFLLVFVLGTPAPFAFAQTVNPTTLVAAGEYAAARSEVADGTIVDQEVIEGLIDQREGRIEDAIAHYRTVLRLRPDLTVVRRLLANALAQDRQYEAAEFHFTQLLDSDPANRASYNRALRGIYARKPFGFSASGAIVPSTNINRGTSTEVFPTDFGDFVIDEDNLGTTGIGFSLNLGAFRRYELDGGHRLQFDAKTGVIVYDKSQFNQHSFTLGAALSDSDADTSWRIAPQLSRAYLAGEAYYNRAALALSHGWKLGDDSVFILQGQGEYRDYIDDDALSGPRYQIESKLRRRIDARTQVEGGLTYKLGNTESAAFQYDGVEISARLSRNFQNGVQLGVGLSYEWRPYRGDFTGVTFPREDGITALDFTVFNDKWTLQGAAPTYSCRLTWAQSNIAFYDYSVQECSIGFTRNF